MAKNYVNNGEFLIAIVDYKALCGEARTNGLAKPQIPNYIGDCILQISRRLASKPNFAGYSYKDEMISDGLENAIQALDNFDPNKSTNPFAYFTQIIWFAFLRRIEKEKKQLYIKHKVIEHSIVTESAVGSDNSGDSLEMTNIEFANDYMNDFVRAYEKKIDEKKKAQIKNKTKHDLSEFLGE
jgi:DNA-directed RNA polymerase specialized sigma24 family protein